MAKLKGGKGKDALTGGSHDDTIWGLGGDDTLSGKAGDDELLGGDGNDLLIPGSGADAMHGGSGKDTVSYADVTGGVGVGVDLYNGVGAAAAAGHTYISVENVVGSSFIDSLTPGAGGYAYGGGGGDVITSVAGAVMRGDAGLDVLTGDSGKNFDDVFWLQLGKGYDQVYSFDQGQDKIRIDGGDFDIGALLNSSELVNGPIGNGATKARPQLIYDQAFGLYFDSDGTGSNAPVLVAAFLGFGSPLSLKVQDFDII